jgi:DNA polymerase-3 subunit alpha (Gram-positive type)
MTRYRMELKLSDTGNGILGRKVDDIDDILVKRIRFFSSENKVVLDLHTPSLLPFEKYCEIINEIQDLTGSDAELILECDSAEADSTLLHKYLSWLAHSHPEYAMLCETIFTYDAAKNTIFFILNDREDVERESAYLEGIEKYLHSVGLVSIHAECTLGKQEAEQVKVVKMEVPAEQKSAPAPDYQQRKKSYKRTKMEDYTRIDLKDVKDPVSDIQFEGDIFSMEEIETKTNRLIQTFSVYDGTDAIMVKRFEGRGTTREMMHDFSEGDHVRIYGNVEYDNFAKDLVAQIREIEKIDKELPKDTAEEKRVEFHMHTNMSEMDGVCDIRDMVDYLWNIGHRGAVITDHADVQSFVKAFNQADAHKKKDPERDFHMGFGCEINMVNDRLLPVRNATDDNIDDLEYVSYDLETTGLSAYYDSIIEFGAVKIKNQTVVDRKQLFIKPPFPIPPYITNKTNITNKMVADAGSFKDVYKEIVEWIGDDVLVAHNATFDYNFLNEELRRIGQPALNNTVIDTLDLARAVLRERRAYRLGNISRYYHVSYDEEVAHRADYDAEALGGIFICLVKDAKEKYKVKTIRDLQEKTQDASIFNKLRRSHACIVVKNQAGMKDLYRLVTESNTKTLAVMGKASGKEGTDVAAEARVLRSSLEKNRENLLVGSACLNGELFELACNGDDERLRSAMLFYDYVELQPLSNYSTDIALGSVPSLDRLKSVQKRLISMAQSLQIPVIADSDAHYCSRDQKIFRDVYIMSQGVGGATHPLFIRDESLRQRTKNPDQHIRFTDEMKKEFDWLQDDKLVEEIVVKAPNRLFDMLDSKVRPVPSGTFPPHVKDSDKKLRQICESTAHKMYEYEGKVPDIVMDRLEMELNNIIKHGYDVHYYIAHLLVKKSNEDGYVVGSRGSVGSSFTATMAGITEVNSLKPHYLCPHCHYSEWIDDPEVKSGFDLPDKVCPKCGAVMKGNGHNIPFQTFLGFNADKVPDIDLNFSNEYQWKAHDFIKQVFDDKHAFRAGTIGTVAEKTAYGYVSGYCEKMNITDMRRAMKDYLAKGCQNVKRTTGQHPGGIIIIPAEYDAEDFTPVQYPANDPHSAWKTTHYDFHDIHDNVLKFDILGHVDPTAIRLMQKIGDRKPLDIPMNDPETLSLFYTDKALKADTRIYHKETGALGLPEFGTRTTRKVLEETRPHKFSELVIISGLSHGTDVWAGNAQELVKQGHPLEEVIGCRDDIMTYLLGKNLEPIDAFKTMEDVRKGRGLRPDQEENLKAHNVPDWYIDSCKKIKYMFPKAHAVAYVMMALRLAWYKVHEPQHFYIQFLTLRCDAYEIETMSRGIETIRTRMQDIAERKAQRNPLKPVSNKENSLYDTLEVCEEIYARGYSISNVDLYKSLASEFRVDPDDERVIVPPFDVVDGLGDNVAKSIEEARDKAPFLSKEDIEHRTQLSSTMIKKLDSMGVLAGLEDRNQMSLF